MVPTLLAVALAAVLLVAVLRTGWSPPARLGEQLTSAPRAALILAAINLLLFGTMLGLVLLFPPALPVAILLGPVASFLAWGAVGVGLTHQGRRRWLVAVSGMAIYLLLIPGAILWLQHVETTAPPDVDTFHAWIGSFVLMAVGLGAFLTGTVTVVLSQRR